MISKKFYEMTLTPVLEGRCVTGLFGSVLGSQQEGTPQGEQEPGRENAGRERRLESGLVSKPQGRKAVTFGVIASVGKKSLIKIYKLIHKFTAARPLINSKR